MLIFSYLSVELVEVPVVVVVVSPPASAVVGEPTEGVAEADEDLPLGADWRLMGDDLLLLNKVKRVFFNPLFPTSITH